MATELKDLHLADLHALAAEHRIERYRLLSRGELTERLGERGATAPASATLRSGPRGEGDSGQREEAPTEPVSGVIDITPRRHGYLRLSGLAAADGDVYVSASQIRRCELRPGDLVAGPARQPRKGERHPALVHVESVNGKAPETERPAFEDSTPVSPDRRLDLGSPDTGSAESDALVRAVDLLAPLALGQRVLVAAAPRSGRTTLLRALVAALPRQDVVPIVVLVDERPEEAAEWTRAFPDVAFATMTADSSPAAAGRVAELALARAMRVAESGDDAVLVVDSLSRLAALAEDTAAVKRLFGSGRSLEGEGTGSLTVIATTIDGDDPDGAHRVVATTENALITLDPQLVSIGAFPPIDAGGTSSAGEDSLRSPAELEAVRKLRAELADLSSADASALLGERIASASSNAELLGTD